MSDYALAYGVNDTNFGVDMYPIAAIRCGDTFDLGVDTGAVLTVEQVGQDFTTNTINFICAGDDGCTYERAFSTDCWVEDTAPWEFYGLTNH